MPSPLSYLTVAGFVGFSCLVGTLGAQPTDIVGGVASRVITGERLRAHMAVLADDTMEGRETGTRGFDRAATYVVGQLRALGLQGVKNSYLQPMSIRRSRVREAQAVLEITRMGRREVLVYGKDYVTYGVRGRSRISVSAPLLFIGNGVTAQYGDVDVYAGLNATGKIAIALPGAPPSLTASAQSYYGDADVKATNAAAHGVAALLLVDEAHIPWDLRVRAARQLGVNEGLPTETKPAVPVIYLNRRAAERIIGEPLDNSNLRAGATIGSARVTVRQQVRDVPSANVYALVAGADGARAREYVVIAAHLDHVGVGAPVNGDSIYNGAVDNASGVAALLTIANAFAALPTGPARSVLLLVTTGEEQGEIGSEYFVQHSPVPIDSIVAVINIDGASVTTFDYLDVRGGSNSSLGAIAEAAAVPVGIQVKHASLGVGGSDHSPFLLAGIPPLWIGATLTDEWMQTRYHTPQDDMRQPLDLSAAARYTQFVFLTSYLTAESVRRPAWNPGEFFGQQRPR